MVEVHIQVHSVEISWFNYTCIFTLCANAFVFEVIPFGMWLRCMVDDRSVLVLHHPAPLCCDSFFTCCR